MRFSGNSRIRPGTPVAERLPQILLVDTIKNVKEQQERSWGDAHNPEVPKGPEDSSPAPAQIIHY